MLRNSSCLNFLITILFANLLYGQNDGAKLAKILADGKVQIIVAQGYIEEQQRNKQGRLQQLHLHNYDYLSQYLLANRYEKLPSNDTTLHLFSKKDWINFKTSTGLDTSALISFEFQLIMPGANSKHHFVNALRTAEILIYQGHGRRGLGPDFDDIECNKGNFVIGLNSQLHQANMVLPPGDLSYPTVAVGTNDLELMKDSIWEEHPRYWLFNVCNSKYYQDEWASAMVPEHIRQNTEILYTHSLISVFATAASTTRYLELILSGCPLAQIPPKLFEAQQTALFQSGLYNRSVIQSFSSCYYWNFKENHSENPKLKDKKKPPSTKRRRLK